MSKYSTYIIYAVLLAINLLLALLFGEWISWVTVGFLLGVVAYSIIDELY